MDVHGELLATTAEADAAQRSGPEIVEAHGYPYMGIGTADAIRRVEPDPAELRDECLRPGMAGFLLGDPVLAAEIPPDITRRNAEVARRRDKDVGKVLAHPTLEGERFHCRGCGVGGVGVIGHLRMQTLDHEGH